MKISEERFREICNDLSAERESVIKHNPIGSENEILLWMLLNMLTIYLSVPENEMPCFNGMPNEQTYKDAILFVLGGRKEGEFDPAKYIDMLLIK